MPYQLLIALLGLPQPRPHEKHARYANHDEAQQEQWVEDPPQQSLYEDGALVHPHRDNLRHGGSHVGPAVRVLCVHEVDDRKAGDDQGRDEHHPDQPGREGRGLVRDLVVRGLVVPPQGESVELVLDESLLGEEGGRQAMSTSRQKWRRA